MNAAVFALLLASPSAALAASGHVGIAADWHDGELVVVSVRADSPADQAGVRHGDRILSIAGKAPKGAADAKRLRGPVGTEVVVSLRARGQASSARTATMFREDLSAAGKDADNGEELEAGAAAGDPVSLTYYALELMRGLNGRKRDPHSALEHLAKAASADFAPARYHLAVALFSGQGGKKDAKSAIELARAAAEQGHPDALHLVGTAYSKGMGVAKDEEEAGLWIRKAAEAGGERAMCALAERLNAARGMPENPEEAAYWAKKALPDACAHYVLALLHRDGRGVAADPLKAYEHAARASFAGHAKSSMLAGRLALLLPKDEVDAIHGALREEGISTFREGRSTAGAAPFDDDEAPSPLSDPGARTPAPPLSSP